MKKGLYQEMSASKIATQGVFPKKSTKHSFKQVFHEQILKRNLHKINLWKDTSTKTIQIETSTTKYLTTHFLPELSNGKSLPNNT